MIKHGTPQGWTQHYRSGVPVCGACRAARNDYRRRWRAARRRLGLPVT